MNFRPFAVAAVLAATLAAQAAPAPARRTGAIFRNEIDALVERLNAASDLGKAGQRAPLGGDSVLANAQILCAMGHCHRRYHVSDGPLVRTSLELVLASRTDGGSFGDAATNAWVAEALAIIDPDGQRDAIAAAAKQGAGAPAFAAAVAGLVAKAAPGSFPQDAGATARGLAKSAGALPVAEAAAALATLVACQVANRQLDERAPKATAVVFSPAQQQGFAWLFAQQQDGVFGGGEARAMPLTGFGLMALQCKPREQRSQAEQAAIEAGLRYLLAHQNDDGTWGESLLNYTTCVAVGALKRWGDPSTGPALGKAQRAILAFQNIERAGYRPSDRDYGSIGYSGQQRGDLSNLHFALQALRETGLPGDHDAFTKAVVFLQRTQNLKRTNDWTGKVPDPAREGATVDAASGDDGGAGYYPGNSSAGYIARPDGKIEPRSYGSMTYALLKAYTLAGIRADDPRVAAAVDWISAHWDLDTNPGADPSLGEGAAYQGLFYYYLLMAQALSTMGVDRVHTAGKDGESPAAVDWRAALRKKLEGMQAADGSWVNDRSKRWMEGEALLATCYAMLALEHCR
jgi:squalene-hopene/tetraprenyl-beta-curcumene cyclase